MANESFDALPVGEAKQKLSRIIADELESGREIDDVLSWITASPEINLLFLGSAIEDLLSGHINKLLREGEATKAGDIVSRITDPAEQRKQKSKVAYLVKEHEDAPTAETRSALEAIGFNVGWHEDPTIARAIRPLFEAMFDDDDDQYSLGLYDPPPTDNDNDQ